MNLEIDQEQSAQSQRTLEATKRIMGEALQQLNTPLSKDASCRTDAAPVYPTEASTAARAGCTYVQLFELAKQRYGHGARLDAYTQGLFDGIESTAQRVGVALTQ